MKKYLYHGTSLYRWRQLKTSGFASVLYLAGSVAGTEMYRRNAIETDAIDDGIPEKENAEIVVTFDLVRLAHLGELQPDWDDVPTNMELFPESSWPGQVSWQDSLNKLGTVAYTGSIEGAVVRVKEIW